MLARGAAAAIACATLWAAAGLGGCAASRQELVVSVRDARTKAPAAGVSVRLTLLNPQHALRPADYRRWILGMEKDGPPVLTNDAGRAVVRAPSDRPFLVTVMGPDLQPETWYLREFDSAAGEGPFPATEWLAAPAGREPADAGAADGAATYEVRIGEPE